jgi:hypothetical protein
MRTHSSESGAKRRLRCHGSRVGGAAARLFARYLYPILQQLEREKERASECECACAFIAGFYDNTVRSSGINSSSRKVT